MIITGNTFKTLYPQEVINWTKSFELLNTTGVYNFYFSGVSGSDLIFSIKNNKVFSYKNELIDGLSQDEFVSYSGNVGKKTFDLYKNNQPLFLGLDRQGSGDIAGFNILTTGSNVDFYSMSILGDKPQYYIDTNLIYNSGIIIPVNITNSGQHNLVIFSGEIVGDYFDVSGLSDLSIPPLGTNTFYLVNNGAFSNDLQQLNLNLYSNIGTENLTITLSSNQYPDDLFYLNVSPPPVTIISRNSLTYTLSFGNYLSSNLEISLEYVSGFTGNYFVKKTAGRFVNEAPVSGLISGQGVLQSTITGLISGYNPLLNSFEYATGSGIGSKFKIAENQIVYSNYRVLSSGYGDIEFISDVAASGYSSNIEHSGYVVYPGSDLTGYVYDIPATGIIFSQQKTGFLKTGISKIFTLWTGFLTGNYNPDEYENVNLTSRIKFVTGTFSTGLNFVGIAYATGSKISGKFVGDFGLNFEPGIYNFTKPFFGLVTGKIVAYTGFDPITLETSESTLEGYLNATVSKMVDLKGCGLEKLPVGIEVTGYPSPETIRNTDKLNSGLISGVDIFNLLPVDSGEFLNENNITQINPAIRRTNISRLYPTAIGTQKIGTGIFDNIFQFPFFTGVTFANETGLRLSGYGDTGFFGWKESIVIEEATESLGNFGGKPNDIYLVSGGYNTLEAGKENVLEFTLTGEKFVDIDNLNFEFESTLPYRILFVQLYQKNYISGRTFGVYDTGTQSCIPNYPVFPYGNISGNLETLSGVVSGTFFDDSNLYFNSTGEQTVLITGLGSPITKLLTSVSGGFFWTKNSKKYGESNFNLFPGSLPTGDYILKSKFQNLIPEPTLAQIGFTHNLFTACEGNRFAQFKIKKLDEYLNYRVYATIRLILRGPNFPQVRQEVIQKGIKWNFGCWRIKQK